MTADITYTEVHKHRVKIDEALSWELEKGDCLEWALADHAEEAAIEAGAYTDEEEVEIRRTVDGDEFVLTSYKVSVATASSLPVD